MNRYTKHRTPVVVVDIVAVVVVVVVAAVGGNDYFAYETLWPTKRECREGDDQVVAGCLCSDRIQRYCASTDDCVPARSSATWTRVESSVQLLLVVLAGPVDVSIDLWCCVRPCVDSLVAALAAFVWPILRIGVFSMAV